jgi:polysaccharide pyruvyl transferase WcaK-like protein
MKIGIMTFWWADDNYGQLLQCYALQKYLRDVGHDAYLIRYDPRNDYVKTPLWRKIIKGLSPVKLSLYIWHRYKKMFLKEINQRRRFNEFRDKYIKQSEKIYCSYDELVSDPPDADVYIVGSDQVWNTFSLSLEQSKKQIKAYFLYFGKPEIRRIAYAASFGKETISNELVKEISPLLKHFNYVSVREKSGAAICRQCGVNAEWVPDPTLLLNANEYRILYKTEQQEKPEKPYLFLYILNNKIDFPIKSMYQWAAKKRLDVIYITGNAQYDHYKKIYATIPEWLYLIDNAEYVVTNSFHGAVFSLVFNKKFGIIPLKERFAEMNNRFDSLFKIFGIDKRFIDDSLDILDAHIDSQRGFNTPTKVKETIDGLRRLRFDL